MILRSLPSLPHHPFWIRPHRSLHFLLSPRPSLQPCTNGLRKSHAHVVFGLLSHFACVPSLPLSILSLSLLSLPSPFFPLVALHHPTSYTFPCPLSLCPSHFSRHPASLSLSHSLLHSFALPCHSLLPAFLSVTILDAALSPRGWGHVSLLSRATPLLLSALPPIPLSSHSAVHLIHLFLLSTFDAVLLPALVHCSLTAHFFLSFPSLHFFAFLAVALFSTSQRCWSPNRLLPSPIRCVLLSAICFGSSLYALHSQGRFPQGVIGSLKSLALSPFPIVSLYPSLLLSSYIPCSWPFKANFVHLCQIASLLRLQIALLSVFASSLLYMYSLLSDHIPNLYLPSVSPALPHPLLPTSLPTVGPQCNFLTLSSSAQRARPQLGTDLTLHLPVSPPLSLPYVRVSAFPAALSSSHQRSGLPGALSSPAYALSV